MFKRFLWFSKVFSRGDASGRRLSHPIKFFGVALLALTGMLLLVSQPKFVSGQADADNLLTIKHNPGASSSARLLRLQHLTNNSDNDADAIYYERNGTELFQVGNKGWIGDKYNGTVGAPLAMPPTPDSTAVTFTNALQDSNYIVVFGGYKLDDVPDYQDPPNTIYYNIKLEASVKAGSKTNMGFTVEFTWTAYLSSTNRQVGAWDNYRQMVSDLSLPAANITDIDWRVVRTL